ncbi:MAG: hypothetical protein ACR2P9_01315 [Gammaproteobacteria bacterium]
MTTLSITKGIEGILYQHTAPTDSGYYSGNKTSMPLSASVPRHVEEVFNHWASERMLSDVMVPKITHREVTVPHNYNRLFDEVATVGEHHKPETPEDQQAVQAAMTLFSRIRTDIAALRAGREADIPA